MMILLFRSPRMALDKGIEVQLLAVYLVYLEFSNPCQHFLLGRLAPNEKSLDSIQF